MAASIIDGKAFAQRIQADVTAAASALADLHALDTPRELHALGRTWPILDFDALALDVNASLFANWYPKFDPRMSLSDADHARWESELAALIDRAQAFPRELTLRDYHAENLIWLPERDGRARVCLLDFQMWGAGRAEHIGSLRRRV